tara:strand:- start:8807 stop:9415 length:609 start_codon:yes stop_codon:yes gene_type:complete
MIGLINYGIGNLGSLKRTFDILDIDNKIIDNPSKISSCTKLVLPGVGNFGKAINILNEDGWSEKIVEHVEENKPLLGICLGMQLLMTVGNEDGKRNGLGLISGEAVSFENLSKDIRIPHVGWNSLIDIDKKSRLLSGILDNTDFYFVHSFFVKPNENATIAYTEYGIKFCSALESNNVYGTQFHPEKSSKAGRKILENFSNL